MVWSFSHARRADRRPTPRRYSPALETLEDRTVLSTPPALTAPGAFDPSTATWYLRSTAGPGAPDAGIFRYGMPGWLPVTGDWDGNGTTTIGAVDPTTMTWYLRNSNTPGAPDITAFRFGLPGWIPVVGDWTGSGHTGIGAFDPTTATWYLRTEVGAGAPDAGTFKYGSPLLLPVTGDWTGSGHSGIGVFDPWTVTWYLRNTSDAGAPDITPFKYGGVGNLPVTGDWDANGTTTIGVVDPSTETWMLRNGNGAGAPDIPAFRFGMPGWQPVAGNFKVATATTTGTPLITLNLNPIDINLLGLEVQTNQIQVVISAQPGQGELLGNLLNTVANLVNLQGVNNALNNVLGSVVNLLDSTSLTFNGTTNAGSLSTAPTANTPVLGLFVAPVHLNLLGALVDTSPIELTITAHSGNNPNLILGNVITDLANLFNPPLPSQLNLDDLNTRLQNLLSELNAQIPGTASAPTSTRTLAPGTEQVVSLTVPPINVNLLGLVLQTSQIQVNADAQTGNGDLLGNVLTTLLNTLGATPQNLTALSNNLNGLLAKVVGVLNASSLVLPGNAVSTLSQALQMLAVPNLVNSSGTASTPILNLAIASTDGTTPPVDVNLLGLIVTTSNIQAQLLAQTGDGQILGNLLYNVANLLNPGGTLNLLTLLGELGL